MKYFTRAALLFLLFAISMLIMSAGARDSFSQSVTRARTEIPDQRVADDPKLDPVIKEMAGKLANKDEAALKAFGPGPVDETGGLARTDGLGNVQVYVYCSKTGQEEMDKLLKLGLDVETVNDEYGIVQGWVRYDRLEEMSGYGFVGKITPPEYGHTRVGEVTTEGDAIIRADEARDFFGVDGTGVKVGVISDGVDTLGVSQLTGDLPDNVQVGNAGDGDEGTAILEIVHDVAPGAELAFYTGNTSMLFLNAIQFFRSNGVDVIIDDIGYLNQPYFQDGEVASAAQDAVNDGIVFISAAGNDGDNHYQGVYEDTDPGAEDELGDNLHDFGFAAGQSSDTRLRVALPPGGSSVVFLQWSDPFGASSNDYDLYLRDSTGEILNFLALGEGISVQNGDDDPIERVGPVTNPNNATAFFDIEIDRFSGEPQTLEIFLNIGGSITEFNVSGDSIYGHPAATGVIAVGATNETDGIRIYSSEGPSSVLASDPVANTSALTTVRELAALTARPKPDVMAPDGVSTTVPNFTNFLGTSAAAPHAAGVAALIIEGMSIGSQVASLNTTEAPSTTRNISEDVGNILKSTAQDIGPAGFDSISGFGRIDAFLAVQSAIENGGGDPGNPPVDNGGNNDDGGGGGCSLYGAGSAADGIADAFIMLLPALALGILFLIRKKRTS